MAYKNIIFEKNDALATITFNRPKVLNALNRELLEEFSHALDVLAQDTDIKVLILTGSGDKAFVAGADISELATFDALQGKQFAKIGHTVIGKLQELPFVVIAAVKGFALGGGTEIALACDFIYAADSATFGQPEIKLGLIPGFGGTQRLARLIGPNRAKELIFTGDLCPADQALAWGIVSRVVPVGDLMETVMATAQKIAGMGKVSLRAAKQAINTGLNTDLATGCHIEIDAFALCLASEDSKEGTQAFLDKRRANFRGRL